MPGYRGIKKEEPESPQPAHRQSQLGLQPSVMEVDAFLEEVARETEVKQEEPQKSKSKKEEVDSRSDRGRVWRRRERDLSPDRYRDRESHQERGHSRDRNHRDASRKRLNRDADTDEDHGDSWRPRDSRRGGGDYYRGGRSRSPRRDRERDRERVYRDDHDRTRYRERSRGRRSPERRSRRTPTPPPNEDDRDKRTIFVQQISQRAETRHLRDFFARNAGDVVDAQIVKDRVTGRSKGYRLLIPTHFDSISDIHSVGYVEFKEEESVAKAIELTGQKLKGVPIIAQLTEAEKNRAARTAGEAGATSGNNGAPFHRLYVGNIHFSVTEQDLQDIFTPFGELEQVTLQRDEQAPNRSKGYGFVQYVFLLPFLPLC